MLGDRLRVAMVCVVVAMLCVVVAMVCVVAAMVYEGVTRVYPAIRFDSEHYTEITEAKF